MTVMTTSRLPLPLWRRGKVREVYESNVDRRSWARLVGSQRSVR